MPFAGGSGTSSDPYQIENWTHLDSVRNNLESYFVLNNNLDSNTSDYTGLGDSWNPIGARDGTDFKGDFDGQGNVIKDLVIESANEGVGLFGSYYPGDGSLDADTVSIRNLGVEGDVTNTGTERYTGIITGVYGADVVNCYVNGTVDSPNGDVGGIAGSGGTGTSTAGLVKGCYSFGSVNGGDRTGGLVGVNNAAGVEDCYNFADVSGNETVGGLLGKTLVEVSTSYSVGTVTASGTPSGGFVGSSFGTITDCYWDTEASGTTTGLGSQSGTGTPTGLTTSEMIGSAASTNMTGFDFTNDWDTVVASSSQNIQEDSYPILLSQPEDEQLNLRGIYVYVGSVSFDVDADVASNVFFDVKSTAGYSIELNGTEVYSQSGGTGGSLVTRSADLSSYSGATTVNIVVLSPGSEYFEFGNVRTDEVI